MRTNYEPAERQDLPAFECQREMKAPPDVLYTAWTEGFGAWFAIPDSVIMRPEVDSAFFFETQYEGQRHPHYGRFLQLEKDRLVSLTWLNSALDGAETIVTVRLNPKGSGALLYLSHTGFPNDKFRDETGTAWPLVLEQQDRAVSGRSSEC
jgi:uncharacterized protein YndB with AHSA1/START domain